MSKPILIIRCHTEQVEHFKKVRRNLINEYHIFIESSDFCDHTKFEYPLNSGIVTVKGSDLDMQRTFTNQPEY